MSIAATANKRPTTKEVDKFFKRAKNSLVSSASLGEIKTWTEANAAFTAIVPEKFSVDSFFVIPESATQEPLEEFSPKKLEEHLTKFEIAYKKQLLADTYVNQQSNSPAKETKTQSPPQSSKEAVNYREGDSVAGDYEAAVEEKVERSVNISNTPIPSTITIDKKEQRKLHRRYENWYSRIPTEKLAENGGCIPSLNSSKQVAELLYYQVDAAVNHFENFYLHSHRARLLRAGVGVGKTYIFGQLLRWMMDVEFHKNVVHSLFPYMVVTKASIVTQTERVLRDKFGLPISKFGGGVMVTNYDQLRASLGDIMITWHTQVVGGEEVIFPIWKDIIHPAVIIWDECQSLKNEDSIQTKVARAYSRIKDKEIDLATDWSKHPCWRQQNCEVFTNKDGDVRAKAPNTWQLFSSATPFTTVAEAKTFALATRARIGREDMEGYKGE